MFYTNLATGQKLSECDFYAYITSTDWSCCGSDEQVWISNNRALTTTEWFAYFSTNTPSCANVAPTCMPVVIKGGDNVGDTLSVASWNVSGIPAPTKTYDWEESTNGGITWANIASGSSYTLLPANVGNLIRVRGNATNSEGVSSCYSAPVTVYPEYEAPSMITGPTITGSSSLGSILTCNPGTYNGFPSSFAFSYQWYRGSLPISGETSSTYKIKIDDSNVNITCHVTIDNAVAPVLQLVSNTITANYFGPVNTVPPVVSGSTSLAGILTCTTGSWTGPNLSYSYQWFVDGVQVGNDNNSLQLILAWSNKDVKCLVTASNSIDTVSVFSNIVTAGDYSPVNTLAPVISVVGGGPANPGTTIATSNGNWTGSNLLYSYQWYAGATPVGSNQTTYQVQNTDTGQNITCIVTATNAGGSGSATSNVISVPSGPGVTPPSNSTAPTITVASGGPVLAGKSLVCNVGVWLGTAPILYSYEWFRGATSVGLGVSYTMVLADIGQPLKCVVTGTNAYGVATANSNVLVPTGQVSLPPSNIVAPMIYVANGGSALAGKALSVDIGAWDGTSPITYSYQWYSNATPVGVDDPSYIMQSSDIGNTITCVVTANNDIGTATATSNGIPVIGTIYTAPSNITPPTISTCGTATVGSCLSSNIGTWDGDDVTYSFEWYSGVSLVGTNENYLLQPSDLGNNIVLKVTALNIYGTAVATSAPVVCLPASPIAPHITGTPTYSGNYVSGQVLTGSGITGLTITGNPTPTISYQWMRNDVAISGATSTTYTLTDSDMGNTITFRVIATNTGGTTYVDSAPQTIYTTLAEAYPTSPYSGYSLFLRSASYFNSANPWCIQVRRADNNATANIGFAWNNTTKQYEVDTNAIIAHCSSPSTQGFVSTWYDQISGNHLTCTDYRIYTGSAIETLNSLPCLSATSNTASMVAVGSKTAGTFKFLHDGTTQYSIYLVNAALNATHNILYTTSGTVNGLRMWYSTTNTILTVVYNATTFIVSQLSPNNITTTNAQNLTSVQGNISLTIASQRFRVITNQYLIANNAQGGTGSANLSNDDFTIGALNTTGAKYQEVTIYKTNTRYFQIRNLIALQHNMS